jgi:tryptophan halogenase
MIKNLIIVGGGTSAWLAAAYTSYNLPGVHVTIIDKEIGTPIGVGEGTMVNFKTFLDFCGIDINEWFIELESTYKAGTDFRNWHKDGKAIWHPFVYEQPTNSPSTIQNLWTKCTDLDFKEWASPLWDISVNYNKIDCTQLENYAYHVNCSKLTIYLQEKLKNRVTFIKSEVTEVNRTASDIITSLELKNGQIVSADYYLDCTGFKGILRPDREKIDLQGRLFTNTAIAGQIAYEDPKNEMRPYIISDAVEHGWIWNIPIQTRIGSGMVFNRDITNIEDAKDYFVNYWKGRVKKEDLRVIDWSPFYVPEPWKGNVISIGLSAGFIEPLESTSIALTMEGIFQFTQKIQDGFVRTLDKEIYNKTMEMFYEETIDFVVMHYDDSHKHGKFWDYVRGKYKHSEKMKYYIDRLEHDDSVIPVRGTIESFFSGSRWVTWLAQLGYTISPKFGDGLDPNTSRIILLDYNKKVEKQRHVWSRNHYEEIQRLRTLHDKND